jgi:hypothetical protein
VPDDVTTATTLDGLPEELREAAVREAERELIPLPGRSEAFLTVGEDTERGLFRRRSRGVVRTGLVIGPRHMVIAIETPKREALAITAALDGTTPQASTELFGDGRLHEAAGRNTLWINLGGERGLYPLRLGPPDGDRAAAALVEAVRRAKAGSPPG